MKNIFTIAIIFNIFMNIQYKCFGQNVVYRYTSSFSFADKNRVKHFNNHTYVASGHSFTKLNSNLEVVWQVKLNGTTFTSFINDFDIVPANSSTLYPDQAILIVGSQFAGSSYNAIRDDNKSFIWRIKDLDGSTQFLNYFDHTGNEGFEKILMHPNPSNSSYKYYITGKSNYTFPTNNTNIYSYRNLLYNINSDGLVNWKKYYVVQSPSAPTGQESQFHFGIVPKTNGNVLLLGSNIDIITSSFNLGNILEINGVNGNLISATQVGNATKNYKLYDGVNINSGGFFVFVGASKNTGSGTEDFSIITTDFVTGFKSIKIDNVPGGFNDVVIQGNDLYAFVRDADNLIIKISNFNSSSPALSTVKLGDPFFNKLSYTSIAFDNSGNLIVVGGWGTDLYIGKIDITLNVNNNYCIFPKTKTFSTMNENVGNLNFNTTSVISTLASGGTPIIGNVIRRPYCHQPCIETVDFTFTPTSCNTATFTPTVTGSSMGPFNYSWDFECDGDIDNTAQNPSYTFPPSGTYCVRLTVRDAMDVECFGTITKNITISSLNVDFNFTNVCKQANFTPIVSGGTGPYTYHWEFNCTAPIVSTMQNPSFLFSSLGTQCVSLRVTDASGLCIGFIQKNIVLLDNIAPTITCPGNVILNTNPEYCYASYGGVSATDNCGTIASITCVLTGATTGTFSNVSQLQYNKGVTMVSCTATDDSGNASAPCTFTVTVFDSSPPFIDCPTDISVTALPCDNSAAVTFSPPTVYDNCPMWTSSCDYMSGDLFPCGNTIVTCTVTDMGGAIASCSFNVNVVCSNSCPQITGSNISCGTSPNTLNYSVTIFNPNPTTNICTYTLSLPPAQGVINTTNILPGSPTTIISGSLTPANSTITVFNLSVIASCICQGNQPQTCNLTTTLTNIEAIPGPPDIMCPGDITLNTLPAQCFNIYGGVSAIDNCDPDPDVVCTLTGATTGVFTNVTELQFNKGITIVTCIATDNDGMSSQCTFTVTVLDNQPPTIECPPNVTAQVSDCSNSTAVSFPVPIVNDNCPMVQYSCSHQSNDIFNCGNTLVTCTATDMAGNTATCNFEVIVACDCVDVVSSVINCDKATHTYLFSINIVNNSGMGSSCTSSVSLDPSQGVILNQTTTWIGNMGTITGAIQPTMVAPFTFNLSVVSECTCTNGLTQNCTSNIQYPITEICTDFVLFDKVYGDGGENYTSTIKAFGDGIYVASYFLNSGIEVATFSKFNVVTGALLWEKKLSSNTKIRDFDYNPDDPTTSAINEETLILVGHTTPLSSGGVDIDNQSFIIGVFPSGALKFSKQYNFTGREQLNKVERHKNPLSGYNFYAVGVRNQSSPAPIPSSWDKTMLINFDINGVVSWIRDYTYRSFPSGDDEILRGLIGLSDGSILITGNDVPRNDGLIVRINGLTGIPIGAVDAIFANNPSPAIDFHDGLELPNGDIVLAGEWFGKHEAIICIFSKGTFSAVQTIKLIERFPGISKFDDIHIDANGNLYVIGHSKDNLLNPGLLPILVKLKYDNGILNILWSKYLLEGSENFFLNPSIHVTPLKDRIYYADTRNNLGFGFGLNDILIGAFDLNLTSTCAFNIPQTKLALPISGSSFPISSSLNFTPGLNIINLIPLTYQCADFCGPTCNVTALFEAVPITCYDMQFNDLSSGGTAPYTYAWDFDCDGMPDASDPNPTWTFPGSGTFTVCLTVTDATGLCSSSTMQTVIVPPDTTDPDIVCPGDITLNTDINQCYATYGGVSATDICDASPDIICTLTGATTGTFTNQSPLQYNKGVTMVSCTATDDSGNFEKCTFKVTVKDNQMPTIFCPPNKVVSAPFCDGGANVTFDPPLISDNCPMASYTCTHASGDFFPCGTTVVTCTVTDMFGNTSSCSFNITVNCTCAQITEAEITCGTLPDTYDFVITVENLSGNGTTCNLTLGLNPLQGTVMNQMIMWNTGNNEAIISGTIYTSGTIPDFFNFTVLSECICPNGTKISCTLPYALESICCKSAFLTDDEICKEAGSHTITLGFNGSVTSITQVNWYISFSNPCPTDRLDPSWQLYASVNQNSASVDVYPPYLSGDFCMYAVVSLTDNPCTELTSDIAHFILCDFVECTLPSQEYCYTGTPVTPSPILLIAGNAHCNFDIEWLDQNGNPIPGSTNQSSYQAPPIIWTAPLTDCKQVFNYSAQVTGPCGPEICTTTITLYNDNAPTGVIEIDPFEVTPICQGEDLTLRFEPVCPEEPQPVTWKWLKGNTQATLGHVLQLGDMNPLVNTNALYQDIWYGVEIQNGVCPPVRTAIFIDIINPLKILNFSANHIAPCRNNGVHLEMTYGSDVCPVTVKWYKDGILIHTLINVTGGFVSYNYYNAGLNGNYSGNYYAIIESTCCPDQIRKSNVIKLPKPLILLLSGPGFRCNDDLVLLEATLLNTNGLSCSFQWYELIGSSFVILAGETTPSLTLDRAGVFKVIVQCGPCILEQEFSFPQCGTTGTNDPLSGQVKIFPNPTSGDLFLHSNIEFKNSWELKIYNAAGESVKNIGMKGGILEMSLSLHDFVNGIYYLQITDHGKVLWSNQIIKVN